MFEKRLLLTSRYWHIHFCILNWLRSTRKVNRHKNTRCISERSELIIRLCHQEYVNKNVRRCFHVIKNWVTKMLFSLNHNMIHVANLLPLKLCSFQAFFNVFRMSFFFFLKRLLWHWNFLFRFCAYLRFKCILLLWFCETITLGTLVIVQNMFG